MMNKSGAKYRSIILAVFVTMLAVQSAWAHPADMFFQEHTITLSPAGIQAIWSIYPGGLLAPLVWSAANQNRDQTISPMEARTWVESHLAEFSVNLDGATPLTWRLEKVEWPASLDTLLVGDETILVRLATAWPPHLTSSHQLIFHNHYQESVSINWFYLHGLEGITFQTPEQQNGQLQINFLAPGTVDASQTATVPKSEQLTHWDSGVPSFPPLLGVFGLDKVAGETETPQPQAGRPTSILTGLLRTPELSPNFYLAALTIAVILGALHAVTPGHGKTVVAAYLVGSRGTSWHAINLGAIVTLTHTGSVFLLGLITLFASQYILPTSLLPILEIVSGLLIVGFGVYLLYRRWPAWRAGYLADHHHHHHHHDHHHHHHDHEHHHHLPDEVTWRSLLTLGVSGGLVPCPDAIAILLVAIAVNRIALGLSLIIAFSLGLALVLIVIGLVMVHSRRLFEKMDAFSRLAPAMPLISATVVVGVGVWLTVSAVINTDLSVTATPTTDTADSLALNSTKEPAPPPFDLDRAGILYLAPDEQDKNQLFRINPGGEERMVLTQQSTGVWGYALSPDGLTIAYITTQDDGRSDIWLIALDENDRPERLPCPELSCSGVVWSPNGQRFIYETLSPPTPDAPSGLPSLWWLDVATRETEPVFQDSHWPGFNATGSPDGQCSVTFTPVAPKLKSITWRMAVVIHCPIPPARRLPGAPLMRACWSRMLSIKALVRLSSICFDSIWKMRPSST
jgi:nickel/cobalt exporter